MMIELGVLLGRDLRARPGPQRRGAVDRLLLIAVGKNDRQGDMIGIALDDLPQPMRFQVLLIALADMQGDAGAARHVGGRLDREAALAVGSPAPALAVAR